VSSKQSCPRRMNEYGPWERAENLDEWRKDRGLVGQSTIGLSCSFCGSLNPARFMELLRAGWTLIPSDKSYKCYIGEPLSDEDIAARKARWVESDGIAQAVRETGKRDGKTLEQIAADLEFEWAGRQELYLSGSQEAKFYFQHLDEAQRGEFIELHNEHRIKFSYPGYLYVLPFFCREHAGESQ
jgi:hypothetical protein